ncbi:hypothetical protein H0H81_011827 [Sphagnurus paluster]|uniref:Protein kinase domain-containing protein n=1 Tax=Sphagnurus paluster TaxID=117069 RepID=A0A9P7GIC0_9AGAR|nr:hypothetical protein H0H81_011827 [Sphagnurus paluster]
MNLCDPPSVTRPHVTYVSTSSETANNFVDTNSHIAHHLKPYSDFTDIFKMTEISPRHLQSNTLNYLVESNVDSDRAAIKIDLVGKIVYDDPAVFRRLRIDGVSDGFTVTCSASLKAENAQDIGLLKDVVANASKKSPEVLEAEEEADKGAEPVTTREKRSGNRGCAEEKKMYDPLVGSFSETFASFPHDCLFSLKVRLFTHIANFGQPAEPRIFQKTIGMLKADESHTFGFPSVSPDVTISAAEVDASNSKKWRHRDAFGEVKPSKKQGPKPAAAGTIPGIVTQSANYARLFLSARPFMLFCVGILIFGTEFCVGIFDRDGVTFSPIHDMFEDTETLVRVVRSVACELSIQELGLDPTVHVLSDKVSKELTGADKYPSALVDSVGSDLRQWCTIGPPIWSSLSYLGRGTNVWLVREVVQGVNQQPLLQGNEMIMKTAWRSSSRTPESDIYMSIQTNPEGLAKFECGGDVRFPGYARFPITVENLRNEVQKLLNRTLDPPTPVLHRLILGTIGRPMWDYTSDLELVQGFRDAVQAHKTLYEQGILHRDISAANVLLTATQNPRSRGFITDVEFARLSSSLIRKPQVTVESTIGPQNRFNDRGKLLSVTEPTTRTHTTFESEVRIKRGAVMTGTAQFMARAILLQSEAKPVVHEAIHDVESFIWVLSYCVMRNLQLRASKQTTPQEVRAESKAFQSLFSRTFSKTTTKGIAAERHGLCQGFVFTTDKDVQKIIKHFMSQALVDLMKDVSILIYDAFHPFNPVLFDHNALLAAIDKAIVSLRISVV